MFGFGTSQAVKRQGPRGSYDLPLLLGLVGLASMGVVMVASSSIAVADSQHIGAFYYLKKHLFYLALGLILAGFAMRVELKLLEKYSMPLLLAAGLMLLAVFVPHFGMRINGARRWLNLVVISFQPVEAVKLILVVYVASFLVRYRDSVENTFWGLLRPIIVAGVIVLLLLAIAATSESYRMKRLTSFMDPWKDPFNDGFQLTQSLMAIGRGEWTGVGLGSSVLKLSYLPEAHTDFILAVIGEELGLAGVIAVIALFALVVARGFTLGLRGIEVNQRFAGYVAFGISMMIGLQAMVSIGVNLGALPTKGLTLPLISSGGSSVLLTCAMAGVLLRATYEINRARDARQMATRMPALAVPDANAAPAMRDRQAEAA
jgi:cell division protein FtsW